MRESGHGHDLDLLISSCANCDVFHILREVCEERKNVRLRPAHLNTRFHYLNNTESMTKENLHLKKTHNIIQTHSNVLWD